MKSFFFCATLGLTFSTNAYAQDSGVYVNIGAELYNDDGSKSVNGLARLGYNLNEKFSLEGEGSVGLIGDNEDYDDFIIQYKVAGFGRLKFPIGEQTEIFGRLGYFFGESEFSDGEGVAWGGGIEYFFNPNKKNSVRFDVTSLEEKESFDTVIASIVYAHRF